MKYGFIGLGNLASAIIKGMVHKGNFKPESICGYDPVPAACKAITGATGIGALSSGAEVVKASDVIIIAVKPQMMETALKEMLQSPVQGKLFISIAAGKDMAFISGFLGADAPLIRVMPNINAKVGAATCALSANARATEEHKEIARAIFNTIGSVTDLPETHMSIFMAIAGASPAYAYMYIDALARVGVKFGLPKKLALEIAASTVLGSAKMVLESGEHPFELIDQVCSPGGTTIEGILALQKLGMESAVHQAVEAAVNKDLQLLGK